VRRRAKSGGVATRARAARCDTGQRWERRRWLGRLAIGGVMELPLLVEGAETEGGVDF
jgi:hypothetical protein